MAIAVVALAGLFVSIYLTLYKLGAIGELTCTVGSCETVQTSQWATFLGLPVAAWGVGYYLATLAVAILGLQERYADSSSLSLVQLAMSGWGVLFSGWLTWLELFVIDAICMWCVISAILVCIIFVLSLLDWLELRREVQAA